MSTFALFILCSNKLITLMTMGSIGTNQNITIGTVIEHHKTINKTTHIYHTLPSSEDGRFSRKVKFNNKRGNKINLYKIIYALVHNGFFVNEDGQQPNQKDVFIAFGEMLGTNFENFQKDLSEGAKRKTTENKSVFASLEETWEHHLDDLLKD